MENGTKKLLHEIPKQSPLRVEVWEEAGKTSNMDDATFHHLDGMYSYCTTSDGRVFHPSTHTPLVMVDGRWEIDYTKTKAKEQDKVD